jgi:ubiquinone/menaquinone biosynthesis C-methylase UbiE
MLNPTFSKSTLNFDAESYIAPHDICQNTLEGNRDNDVGEELRLQSVYGDEIWLKLAIAGIQPDALRDLSVLEVCGGGGFLTYHLLQRTMPKDLTVNDISQNELSVSERLISTHYPTTPINYVLGDMHEISFKKKFDLIIGNSFLHHFHNVPKALARFRSLLMKGGYFISLHEPTPMATVLEGAKTMAYPLTVVAPGWINEIVRSRYHGLPSATDIWMFEPRMLKKMSERVGFSSVELHPWHLLRPYVVQKMGLHLSAQKSELLVNEERVLRRAIKADSLLNRVLPVRFFGSVCLVCKN